MSAAALVRTTHDVVQGTGPWLQLRQGYDTASEAPAALGVGKYTTRAELLRQKHTGVAKEYDQGTLARFRAGHNAEAAARQMAEVLVGSDLYPVTMSVDIAGLRLLASLDGLTMDDTICWETKLWNEDLAAAVRANNLPEHYTVQMDQELLVTGAQSCLFTCTDGTPERFVSCVYLADEAKFEALIDGWIRFHKDLDAYVLPESAPAAPVGKAPETLPALRIEVTGEVTASNLAEFKQTALGAIRSVNRDLQTDADFADADKAVKWCAEVESKLKAAKEHAQSQATSIDALFKALDDIAAESKAVRLDLTKVIDRRKIERKEEAVVAARKVFDAHIATLNAELAPMRLQPAPVDFAGAIKGLRSFASMDDALQTAVANAKIGADAQARLIRGNVAAFKIAAEGLEFLFADLGAVIHKAPDDFAALLQARIGAHRTAEAEKVRKAAEAEAQRIAAAEQRGREQEAARIAAQQAEDARVAALALQREQDAAAESARIAAAALAAAAAPAHQYPQARGSQQVLKAEAAMPDATARDAIAPTSPRVGAMGTGQAADAAPQAPEPATLRIADINARLSPIRLDAAGLSELGIQTARTEGAEKLYRESDFTRLLRAIARRINDLMHTTA